MPASYFRLFLDTNVLLYSASRDGNKASRAEQLLRNGGSISVQVLNELANVARRKMGMSWKETREFLSPIRDLLKLVPMTEQTHLTGVRLAERYKLSIYDAMIVAAALSSGCDVVLSEDMQHELEVDGRLVIRNPFL